MLARGVTQKMEATDDSTTQNGRDAHEDNEQLHYSERRR
jgi:hypothetical protein